MFATAITGEMIEITVEPVRYMTVYYTFWVIYLHTTRLPGQIHSTSVCLVVYHSAESKPSCRTFLAMVVHGIQK